MCVKFINVPPIQSPTGFMLVEGVYPDCPYVLQSLGDYEAELARVANVETSAYEQVVRVDSLESRLSLVESSVGVSPSDLDPTEAASIFFLFFAIPLVLFVSARGFGTMLNMILGRHS